MGFQTKKSIMSENGCHVHCTLYMPRQKVHICELPKAEFKEFEPRLTFETQLKYGWFHFKLFSMFQDSSRRSIKTGFLRIY